MPKIEYWFKQDLKKPVRVNDLNGVVFTLDNVGSRIGVEVFDDGEPVTLTGTVNGYVIVPGETTVSVAGTRSNNTAYIELPQSALAVPGFIKIAIKLTNSSEITTLLAVVATVYKSRTDTIITPSQQIITDWSQQIAAEMQAVEDASAAQDDKIDDLKSAIPQTAEGYITIFPTWEKGSINASGVEVVDNGRYRTVGMLDAVVGNNYTFTGKNYNSPIIRWYDANGTFKSSTTSITPDENGDSFGTVSAPQPKYRVVINTDNTTTHPTSPENLNIKYESELLKRIADDEDDINGLLPLASLAIRSSNIDQINKDNYADYYSPDTQPQNTVALYSANLTAQMMPSLPKVGYTTLIARITQNPGMTNKYGDAEFAFIQNGTMLCRTLQYSGSSSDGSWGSWTELVTTDGISSLQRIMLKSTDVDQINANNYTNYYSPDNQPNNSIALYSATLTSSQMPNLPVYGYTMLVQRITQKPGLAKQYGDRELAFVDNGDVYYRSLAWSSSVPEGVWGAWSQFVTGLSKDEIISKNAVTFDILGDSFSGKTKSWHYYVAKYLGWTNKNYSVSGSRIALDSTIGGNTRLSFLHRCADVDPTANAVVIFGGINDATDINNGNLSLGDMSSTVNTITDTATTFYGALRGVIEYIHSAGMMPGKPIIGIIPPDFEPTPVSRVTILRQIQEAEREIYSFYQIPYIDLAKECQEMYESEYNNLTYRNVGDGAETPSEGYHPSTLGYKAIANTVWSKMFAVLNARGKITGIT